jgi:hypothetical protein
LLLADLLSFPESSDLAQKHELKNQTMKIEFRGSIMESICAKIEKKHDFLVTEWTYSQHDHDFYVTAPKKLS